jgi:hypothetical protein
MVQNRMTLSTAEETAAQCGANFPATYCSEKGRKDLRFETNLRIGGHFKNWHCLAAGPDGYLATELSTIHAWIMIGPGVRLAG